jgi:hypothetical protein
MKRERGWKMPENTVKVDRTSKFGKPFTVDRYGRDKAVALHKAWITGEMTEPPFKVVPCSHWQAPHLAAERALSLLPTLVGKDLACCCSFDGPCHADTLLELANFMRERTNLLKVG